MIDCVHGSLRLRLRSAAQARWRSLSAVGCRSSAALTRYAPPPAPLHQGLCGGDDAAHGRLRAGRIGCARVGGDVAFDEAPSPPRPHDVAALHHRRALRQRRAVHSAGVGRGAHHERLDVRAQRVDAPVHRSARRRVPARPTAPVAALGVVVGVRRGRSRRRIRGRRPRSFLRCGLVRGRPGRALLRHGVRVHAAPSHQHRADRRGLRTTHHGDRAVAAVRRRHVGNERTRALSQACARHRRARCDRNRRRLPPELPHHCGRRRDPGIRRDVHHPRRGGHGRGRRAR